jgi:hypothetical protein
MQANDTVAQNLMFSSTHTPIHLFREMLEPGLTVQMARHTRISCDGSIMLMWWRRRNIRIQVNPSGKDHGVSWRKHYLTAYQLFLLEHNIKTI